MITVRDVLDVIDAHWRRGEAVALAIVVSTFNSAPRPAGATMVVCRDHPPMGSVSGGCVEGAAHESALDTLETGVPTLQRYGIGDDNAFSVGLTCGGIIDIWTQELSPATFPEFDSVMEDVRLDRPVAIATIVEHPDAALLGRRAVIRPGRDSRLDLGSELLDHVVYTEALGLIATGTTSTVTCGPEGERIGTSARIFISTFAPRPRLLLFGAVDFSAALSHVGRFLGFAVTVCDARGVFAVRSRFPDADEVVVDWPHRYLAAENEAGRIDKRTMIVVLTHDPKFDVPLLEAALRLDIVYVGAMGSRRTHHDRHLRLKEAGLDDDELARLSSPIGLDLGARTSEETAISIAAELVARRWGGSGAPLTGSTSSIHR
jgi:xanthine dehydrogenase accessory factor